MQTLLHTDRAADTATAFATLAERPAAVYTAQDHQVWNLLYSRQSVLLQGKAHPAFLGKLEVVGFTPDAVPDFEAVSDRLEALTGFRLLAVDGIVADDVFFELLSRRIFPATDWIRRMDQLDYLEEPDLFHDVFGHVPLLADPHFAAFLEGMAKVALKYVQQPPLLEMLTRLYWYTVEFGLMQSEEGLRIYGAGILSSVGETAYALGEVPARIPFDAQTVMATGFHKDRYQDHYFVISSFEELYEALPEIDRVLGKLAALDR